MSDIPMPEAGIMANMDIAFDADESQVVTPRPVAVEDCNEEDDQPTELPPQISSPSSMSTSAAFSGTAAATMGSGSSSGSNSTVICVPRKGHRVRRSTLDYPRSRHYRSSKQQTKPNALQFLDPDSPEVPQYNSPIRHPRDHPVSWRHDQNGEQQASPTAQSNSSAGSGSLQSDVFSEPTHEVGSDRSWTPEPPATGDPPLLSAAQFNAPFTAAPPKQPIPPPFTQSPGQGGSVAYLQGVPFQNPGPQPGPALGPTPGPFQSPIQINQFAPPSLGHVPLSGYQALAAKLSGEVETMPHIKPLYRRFETMTHRLLLCLQDEITELEEQFINFDAAETQGRRVGGGFMPATRRDGPMQGEDKQRCRELLGDIGWKLSAYNQVLASFNKVQKLPSPSRDEIQDYQTYLAIHRPIQDTETRFLEKTNDLVSLAREPHQNEMAREGILTPMPRPTLEAEYLPSSPTSDVEAYRSNHQEYSQQGEHLDEDALRKLAFAILIAILVPILTFVVIPGFVGRMTVVMLVGVGVVSALIQAGLLSILADSRGGLDCILCIGLYGAMMAVIAGAFGGSS